MATPRERYSQQKSNARRRGIFFHTNIPAMVGAWEEKSGAYEARGRGGWVMAQSVTDDGFIPGNVEIIPATEVFRREMDAHYGDRDYL